MKKVYPILAALLLAAALLLTHAGGQASPQEPPRLGGVQVVEVPSPGDAILSFRSRGTTTVEMRGTERMPEATVELKVESRPGFVEIDINRGAIKNLQPAYTFGRDFLTYVLWTVSVDGAAMNVGEITFRDAKPISINVTTPYQTFWMMVTAEPDFAVNDPSPVVVLVSQAQGATGNRALAVPGRLVYYTNYADYDTSPRPEPPPPGVPQELLQARKAVELAESSGILAHPTPAEEDLLPDELRTRQTLNLARSFLAEAEIAFAEGGRRRETVQFARTAAQIAENARALSRGAVGGIYVRQLERDLDRLRARYDTQAEELRRLQDRYAQLEASLDEERTRSKDLETQLLALRERISLLEDRVERAERENTRLANERDQICAELRRQLSSIGQLQQRGGELVLTLASDILFDFNKYDLRPEARETLAKLGVVRQLLFRDAPVRYEGHTDLVGDEDYNQWLSEQRALAVYRYFLQNRLARTEDEAARTYLEEQLQNIEQLLAMTYNQTRRNLEQRRELLTPLGSTVMGKGMREPVVPEQGRNEQNRRVTIIFPQTQAGEISSLCPEVRASP